VECCPGAYHIIKLSKKWLIFLLNSDNSNFWHMAVEVSIKLLETSIWSKEIVMSMQYSL
jgi:hypothetical protein